MYFITLSKNAFSSPNLVHFHLLSAETSLFCNSEGLTRPMASRRALMKSILGRGGEAVAGVFFPDKMIRLRVGMAGHVS